jgi:hypothetical protein
MFSRLLSVFEKPTFFASALRAAGQTLLLASCYFLAIEVVISATMLLNSFVAAVRK